MASHQETVDFILGKIQSGGAVTVRKMFGEYSLYCEGKMIALVADDQLFVKPTAGGKNYLGSFEEAPPYPGAKNWLLIPEEDWDDSMTLSELIRITTAEAPLPKPKKSPTK